MIVKQYITITSIFICLIMVDIMVIGFFGNSTAFFEFGFMVVVTFYLRRRLQTLLDLPVYSLSSPLHSMLFSLLSLVIRDLHLILWLLVAVVGVLCVKWQDRFINMRRDLSLLFAHQMGFLSKLPLNIFNHTTEITADIQPPLDLVWVMISLWWRDSLMWVHLSTPDSD